MYLKAENTTIVEFPIINLRTRFPDISFPQEIFDRHLPAGVASVHTVAYPPYNPATHKVQQWEKPKLVNGRWELGFDVVPLTEEDLAAKAAADLAAAKAQRQSLVDAITVTTASGKVFDGNEEAQRRMTSAITAMDDGDELPWVLHDNTVSIVTRAELREALRLAGSEMAAIWIAPYIQQ